MIDLIGVLEEFVNELVGPEESQFYRITSNTAGVSFKSPYVSNVGFSLVVWPMLGIHKGHVGIGVTYDNAIIADKAYKVEDPDLFEKISSRIDQWLVHFKNNRPLKTDWPRQWAGFKYE